MLLLALHITQIPKFLTLTHLLSYEKRGRLIQLSVYLDFIVRVKLQGNLFIARFTFSHNLHSTGFFSADRSILNWD